LGALAAVCGVIAFLILNPYLSDLLLPVAVYIIAIVTMMWRAAALVGAHGKSRDFELAALLGAMAFGLSDTLLALNHFIWHDTLTFFNINQAAPFVSTLVIILYWLGQWGIALSAGWETKDRARGALAK
jgi:alkenylglycerophosphocholine/alkenylglycerophosphoethanolamine hydrolase